MMCSTVTIVVCVLTAIHITEGYTTYGIHSSMPYISAHTPLKTTPTRLPPLHLKLQAVPDHPVTEGQSMVLHCLVQSGQVKGSISWMLKRDQMTEVGKGVELKLTHPEQSGLYHCKASSPDGSTTESEEHYVYIVSLPKSVLNDLGIAGFVLVVVTFFLILALFFWLVWQKFSPTASTITRSKGPANSSEIIERPPQADTEEDVYVNYTSSDEGYTDLDPSKMPEDSVYSSFS